MDFLLDRQFDHRVAASEEFRQLMLSFPKHCLVRSIKKEEIIAIRAMLLEVDQFLFLLLKKRAIGGNLILS